ncbi:odorant receptor 4 isoform X2 [Ooceraea biroi]|uniref:odorant receptor 4 isoform X2 n=1 Tax=Ooceraea biroi TaxID=2015173 RepID=UPI0005B79FA1|nr:odorant receptor 4 isoform X2 [Ooceraea biroi]
MKVSLRERYFNFNRIMLLSIGLWPYQQSTLTQLQLVVLLSILISFIIFQFSRLIFVDYTYGFVLRMLSISSLFVLYVTKYISFWINIDAIKCTLERLQDVYNELTDKNEIAIYEEYGKLAKQYTIKFIFQASILSFAFVMESWPFIFDIVIPKNDTYTRHLINSLTSYYLIQEKYFFFVLLHINAAHAVGSFVLVGVGALFVSYGKCISGMFKIACFRLERAMAADTLQNIYLKNHFVTNKYIIGAVQIHRKAMEFADYLIYCFEKSLLFIAGTTVFCVSLNLYRMSQIEKPLEEIEETLTHFFIMFFVLVYLFIGNYIGQEVIDNNDELFITVYNIPWYQAPLHIQKLILILLQRNCKPFALNFHGIFVASLECFAMLVSASVSYFTIMISLQ